MPVLMIMVMIVVVIVYRRTRGCFPGLLVVATFLGHVLIAAKRLAATKNGVWLQKHVPPLSKILNQFFK